MTRTKNPRIEALRQTAKFLYIVAEGAPTSLEEFKTFSNLCWLQVPMKYRMSREEIYEIRAHPGTGGAGTMSKHPEHGPATKPSQELLRRAREFRDALGEGQPWNSNRAAQFAEQIVRECAEVAKHELAFTTKTSDVTSAILRKFGLKE